MSVENKCPTCGRRGTLRSEGGGRYRCSFCGAPALLMKREETPEIRAARLRLEQLKRNAPKPIRTARRSVRPSPPKSARRMECWMFNDGKAIVRKAPKML